MSPRTGSTAHGDSSSPSPKRPSARKKTRLGLLQIVTHIGAWIPLIVLVHDYLTNNLTINPIQAAEQRTGNIALILLVLSLTCTPLNTLLHYPPVLKLSRPLGLYGYMYASIHLLTFAGIDYGFDLRQILQAIVEKPFVLVGLAAFIVLSSLAITSFRWWMVRMGKNWKRLHRLVYAINLLVVLHFGLSIKGDFFHLRGDVYRPLIAGGVITLLLVMRIPPVRRYIARRQWLAAPDAEKSTAQPPGSRKDTPA